MHLLDCVTVDDEVILVVDLPHDNYDADTITTLTDAGIRVVLNGDNRGLSYSRNRAMCESTNRMVVFVDDDVILNGATVDAIRSAADAGAHIVGVWLQPVFITSVPWFLTGGQYHYLGAHHTREKARTWGACMAIDVGLAKDHSLRFRDDLGRRGGCLQSGDDTTFIAELQSVGARHIFLDDAVARHQVLPERATLSYLVRRAWWQGRSEVRRGSAVPAISKEWGRALAVGPASASLPKRVLLALAFSTAFIVGIAWESAVDARTQPGPE
jgi:glycosyltransferase involved in cell wall biosynthesis